MSSQNTAANAASAIVPRGVHARCYRLFLTRHHGRNENYFRIKISAPSTAGLLSFAVTMPQPICGRA
jgi:hypothetical protein